MKIYNTMKRSAELTVVRSISHFRELCVKYVKLNFLRCYIVLKNQRDRIWSGKTQWNYVWEVVIRNPVKYMKSVVKISCAPFGRKWKKQKIHGNGKQH
jgi:hypothetical protein